MIAEDLRACFPNDHQIILSLSYYLVCESDSPMCRFNHWARIHAHPYGQQLPSQRISEVFARISYDGIMCFLSRQRKRYADTEHLVYDTTSISSYSELLRQVRYGNNKSGEPLPQLNLAMIFGQTSMMPVYYRTLPGNVTDVTTLRKLLQDLKQMEMSKIKLVLDREFYSAANIDALYKHHCMFIPRLRVAPGLPTMKRLFAGMWLSSDTLHCCVMTSKTPHRPYGFTETRMWWGRLLETSRSA